MRRGRRVAGVALALTVWSSLASTALAVAKANPGAVGAVAKASPGAAGAVAKADPGASGATPKLGRRQPKPASKGPLKSTAPFALLTAASAPAIAARGPAVVALQLDPVDTGIALSHAATAMGFPLYHTLDVAAATRFPLIILAGETSAPELPPAVMKALERYLVAGGIVVVDSLESTVARNLAGIERVTPSKTRLSLTFDTTTNDPGFSQLTRPESRTISLGSTRVGSIWTQGFKPNPALATRVLASFDDGSAGLTLRLLGRGRIYALGARFEDLILRPQVDRDFEAQRFYDNHFEPGADVPQLLLRGWYLGTVPDAVTLDPVPDGREGSLVLSHDIDFQRSVGNMPAYVAAEHAQGVTSTFFVQTKIVKDYEDIAFFDDTTRGVLRTIAKSGVDIESHTVAHAYDWRDFPLGTGKESPENYRPYVENRGATAKTGTSRGGSVIGEIRVSKQLLDQALVARKGAGVKAFRTGYLAINGRQWDVLASEGYTADSSFSADDVMTSFPYTAMAGQGFTSESPITEFPVLLADSLKPLLPHADEFNDVLDGEATIHGMAVVLIHPDVVEDKLPMEMALIEHVKGRFWIGSLRDFARFWAARSAARLTVKRVANQVNVDVVAEPAAEGLTLDFPRAITLVGVTGATSKVVNDGKSIVLNGLKHGTTVHVTVSDAP